ncbi:MAG: hypothetical protein AAGU05_11445, partial [Anaerolineaceae bacterium]
MKPEQMKHYGLLAVFTVLICAAYLWWNSSVSGPGFPLDDSWIHQTFARNLAETGRWEYVRGEPAAGSTSPLWTGLLSVGYLLGISYQGWTVALGIIGLALAAVVFERVWRAYRPSQGKPVWPLFGALIASEWHLVWSALSGMETVLYILAIGLVFYLLLKADPPWLLLGGLTGLLVWVRPDGLTLLGPVLLLALWNNKPWPQKMKDAVLVLAGLIVPIGLYLTFNYRLDG